MRVSCERCSTEYDFDITLIAREGTRVRCTNCGHVFRLMPEADVAENWIVRTLDGDLIEIATIAELKSRIISREFTEDDEIRRGEEPWKGLGDIPELAAHFDASRSRESRPRDLASGEQRSSSDLSKKTLIGIGLAPVDEHGADAPTTDEDEPTTTEAPPQYHRTIQMQPGAIPPPTRGPAPQQIKAPAGEPQDPALRSTFPSTTPLSMDKTLIAMSAPPPAAGSGAPSHDEASSDEPPRGSSPTLPSIEPSDQGRSGWFETPSMTPPEPRSEAGGALEASGRAQLHFDEDDEIFPGRRSKRARRGGLGVWLALLLGLGFGLGVGFRDSLPEPLREGVNDAFDAIRGLFISEPSGEERSSDEGEQAGDPDHPAIAPEDAGDEADEGEASAAGGESLDQASEDQGASAGDAQGDDAKAAAAGADQKGEDATKKPKPSAQAAAQATPAAAEPSLGYDALIRRADSALERGRSAAARRDYEQALELRPGASEALTGLGFIALDTGSANTAATHFRRAAANGYADAYIGLGDAYRKLNRHEDALAAYERYLERWPSGNQASVARAQASALRARLSGD